MKLADWHLCSRWNDNVFLQCPFTGSPGHEDDDREQKEHKAPDHEVPVADSPLFFAFDRMKKEVEDQTTKPTTQELTPVRELFPKEAPAPVEVPGIAATTIPDKSKRKFDGEEWLQNFRRTLAQAAPAPATAPATSLSPAPNRALAPNTSRAASLASSSEQALTKSLIPWRSTARPWDTGASSTPADVMGKSNAPEATSPWKSNRRSGKSFDWQRAYRFAAAGLIGAGAYKLSRGFGGGGGGTSQSPKFRGGSERGAEWAIP